MMSKFEEYFKEVGQWNERWKKFLEAEEISKSESVWDNLDRFTDIVENLSSTVDEKALVNLQLEVETLHNEMENYFSSRQQVGSIWINEPAVPLGQHKLPPLAYPYESLEPFISSEIMKLHHQKHHQTYVDGLNQAEENLKKARENGDYSLLNHWTKELAFHGSGHYLHTVFWENMSPKGGGKPEGKLINMIDSYFGSFEVFKKHFTEAGSQLRGAGWALLVWSPRSRHLEILQSESHMIYTQWDTTPLLVLDVWEHAYYPQYKNNRRAYAENWWQVVNWRDVEKRLERASEIKWPPY